MVSIRLDKSDKIYIIHLSALLDASGAKLPSKLVHSTNLKKPLKCRLGLYGHLDCMSGILPIVYESRVRIDDLLICELNAKSFSECNCVIVVGAIKNCIRISRMLVYRLI